MDEMRRKEMQKKALPLYVIQFVLVLFQVHVLVTLIESGVYNSGIETALWVVAAFVVPTVAAAAMWTNDAREVVWGRFLIQSGYYLVLFVAFGYIITTWG